MYKEKRNANKNTLYISSEFHASADPFIYIFRPDFFISWFTGFFFQIGGGGGGGGWG